MYIIYHFGWQNFVLDIDECAVGDDGCNTNTSECVNAVGGYECQCLAGFKKDSQGTCIGKLIFVCILNESFVWLQQGTPVLGVFFVFFLCVYVCV